jgi:FKBP-type peptidyl-prolyl cis-trans isomerase FklB
MKRLGLGLLFCVALISCVSESENAEVLRERERLAFEEYITANNIVGVRVEREPALGFIFIWLEESGSDVKPQALDTIKVDYVGRLVDNLVFDTSIDSIAREVGIFDPRRNYQPFEYIHDVGSVVLGFDYAISKMDFGDKMIAFIPSIYAYGAAGQGNIRPNTPLIFELHLLSKETEGGDSGD